MTPRGRVKTIHNEIVGSLALGSNSGSSEQGGNILRLRPKKAWHSVCGPESDPHWSALAEAGADGEGGSPSHRAPLLPRDSRHGLSTRRIAAPTGCPLFPRAWQRTARARPLRPFRHRGARTPVSCRHEASSPQRQLLPTARLRAISTAVDHRRSLPRPAHCPSPNAPGDGPHRRRQRRPADHGFIGPI